MNTKKKLMTLLLLALLLPITATALPPTNYDNYEFEVDGIYYKIEGNVACVTYQRYDYGMHLSDYHGDVVIPATVTYQGKTYPVTIIDCYAFNYCQGVTSITIPESITTIRSSAFYECSGLTSVNIIDLEAWCNIDIEFNPLVYAHHLYLNDTEVTDLTIPDGITAIKDHAFEGCTGLTSVSIPNSVVSIGNHSFEDCEGITSVNIPNSVTEIGEQAFRACSAMTSLSIGDSVTNIGPAAFEGCLGLTSLNIGQSVTIIGDIAFRYCTGLTTVKIPDTVTYIGMYAFEGCTGLKSVSIGKSVTTIESGAFEGCWGLTSIKIPDSVTEIGGSVFQNCTSLRSVTLGKSVANININSFENAPAIESVTCKATTPPWWYNTSMFSENVYNHAPLFVPKGSEQAYKTAQTWGQFSTIMGVDWEASGSDLEVDGIYYVLDEKQATATVTNFSNGAVIITGTEYTGDIVIPETITSESGKTYTVTAIGNYAFDGCTLVSSVSLPNTILSLGDFSFVYCSGLTSLSIPESVTSIGEDCFVYCTGLTELKLPEGITSIGHSAFASCTNLADIYIPNSLTSIGQDVFYRTAWFNNQPDGIIYAGPFAYCYKGAMPDNTTIEIKPGIRYIADYAFSEYFGEHKITSVVMPNSLISVGRRAFLDCTRLEAVQLSSSLIAVEERAFEGCTQLMSFDFPNSLRSIGESAFSHTGWYDVQPDGLVYAGTVAYHYKGRVPEGTQLSIQDGTTSIADAAFMGDEKYYYGIDDYEGLLSVDIPNSVKYIGSYAFLDDCPNLSKVTIGSGVEDMGNCSFAWIPNLTDVTINEGVKLIGKEMFSGCPELKKITIPNSVEVIRYRAFAAWDDDGYIEEPACISLAEVTIGCGVKSIEAFSFSGCTALTNITCLATTPPVLEDENCFDDDCYSRATLFVPAEVVDVYRTAPIWERFTNIKPVGSGGQPGDVNGDGEVTIGDANSVIDIVVMGGNAGHTRIPAADVNGDGEVNIADVNAVIDMIIKGN